MPKKNILFVTINFPPNPTVGTRRVSKILKYLDYEKFNVSVLTLSTKYYNEAQGSQTGDRQKIPPEINVYRTDMREFTALFTYLKAKLKKILNKKSSTVQAKSNIHRSKKNEVKQNKGSLLIGQLRRFIFSFLEFPDKYIGWAGRAIREGTRIIKDERIDIVITTAPPHSIFLVAAALKMRTGVKLVLDFRDPWALASWINTKGVTQFLKKKLEKFVVLKADLLIFVTENLLQAYRDQYTQIEASKFKLFSNGYDPDDFPLGGVIPKTEPRNFIRMVHLGTLYKKRDPMPFIRAIEQLRNDGLLDNISFRVDFIGTLTPRFARLPQEVKELSLDDVIHFSPPVSFAESIRTMYDADILLLIQPETHLQIPAKLFEYMYTRKPIFAITEPGSASEQMIQKGNLGITAMASDIQNIKSELLAMFQFIKNGNTPNNRFIDSFNYVNYIKEFVGYIDSL